MPRRSLEVGIVICPTCGSDCDELGLGDLLKAARLRAGLSREQLARVLGYHPDEIKRWEVGRSKPHPQNMKVIRIWLEAQ